MLNLLKYLRARFSPKKKEEQRSVEESVPALEGYTAEEMFGKEEAVNTSIPEDFEKAARYLALRIYRQDFISSFKLEEFVYRKDLEGTITMLVLDLPDSVESLLKADIEKWQRTPDELYARALDNMKEKFPRETERLENNLLQLSGDDIFITSEALLWEMHKHCLGQYGVIFCLPNRHSLVCQPINSDLDVEFGLQVMIPYAENTFDESLETGLTRHIFWHYEGKNELIYTYYGPNRLKYVLPTALEEMVY
jgi:hypothetical protein